MTDRQREIDEKWSLYPVTVLEFRDPPSRIDLREPIDNATRRLLREIGLDRAFAVVTGENPGGEHADDEPTASRERECDNATRSSALEDELTRERIFFIPVDGVSPAGDHRERGVAAILGREAGIELARRYKQLAMFWFDGQTFWLFGAIADKPPEMLPR